MDSAPYSRSRISTLVAPASRALPQYLPQLNLSIPYRINRDDSGGLRQTSGLAVPSSLLAPPSSFPAPRSSLLAPPSSLLPPHSSLLPPPSSIKFSSEKYSCHGPASVERVLHELLDGAREVQHHLPAAYAVDAVRADGLDAARRHRSVVCCRNARALGTRPLVS